MFQRSRRRKTPNWHAEGANYPRITTSRFLECYYSSEKTGPWNYFRDSMMDGKTMDAARDGSFPPTPRPGPTNLVRDKRTSGIPSPYPPHTGDSRQKSTHLHGPKIRSREHRCPKPRPSLPMAPIAPWTTTRHPQAVPLPVLLRPRNVYRKATLEPI